jgi:UDP-N-acetylmuramoyl-L-alanine---L-glutamate ligase
MQQLLHGLDGVVSILIYGYGVEGISSVKFLKEQYPHIRITIYDENNLQYSQNRDLNKYDLVIVSPGVNRKSLEKYKKAVLTSATELFFELLPSEQSKKILAVTGTKGKSTTVKYLYDLLQFLGKKAELAGNFGAGVLELLPKLTELDYVVLELSSFQLEYLTHSPHFAGFVNFYEDHLDRHETMKAYFEAKSHIFKFQTEGDLLFLPSNFDKSLEPARSTFELMSKDEESRAVITEPLPFGYFEENSLLNAEYIRNNIGIVAEMVRRLEVRDPGLELKIKEFSKQFVPLEHRLELVAEFEGKQFINDSQSTNQYSTIAGMQALGQRLGVLILGGKDKQNHYELLIDEVLKLHPFLVILDTEVGKKLIDLLEKNKYENYVIAKKFSDAVDLAFDFTGPGKVCLLSPAAASFDWFKNYKDRGDQFKKLISKLILDR